MIIENQDGCIVIIQQYLQVLQGQEEMLGEEGHALKHSKLLWYGTDTKDSKQTGTASKKAQTPGTACKQWAKCPLASKENVLAPTEWTEKQLRPANYDKN